MIHLEYEDLDIEKEKTKYKKYFGFEPFLMNLSNLAKKKEHIFLELFKCIDKELIKSIFKEASICMGVTIPSFTCIDGIM